jgi:N-acyl-D-aspartate/D-glutamate deacylase
MDTNSSVTRDLTTCCGQPREFRESHNFGRIPAGDAVRIAISPHQPEYAGRTIDDIARSRSCNPLDAACDGLIADRGHTRILVTSMAVRGRVR